jgi:hypothetical protein
MNLSDFQSAVKGEMNLPDFFLKIKSEVDAYRSIISSGKKGIKVPIYLEEDVDDFTLSANHVKKLGHSFLNKEIDVYELSYLADALTLSETISYDNENSKDAVYSFTDPEINGEITYESVQKIIDQL